MQVDVKILDKRLGTTFAMPEYATIGSAGLRSLAAVSAA